jgi:response regulator RpfG family c-di-GMP phosphodiesterase
VNEFDLLIVDYMMPDIDGIQFIQQLKQHPERKHLPILMVTADHQSDVRYRALEAGANDFLTKPIDRIEFNSRVRNMLALRSSLVLLADRAAHLASEVHLATAEIRSREREMVMRLARAAEFRDPETGAHIQRMAHFSCLIAENLGWKGGDLEMLLEAAPMHDVGKVGTPDAILLKPGRLTGEEFEVMKQHATIGWKILNDSTSPVLQMAAEIALSHHEKFDGTGYPHGKAGAAIPLTGRIVAVADVFDALTSVRPYKPAWEVERALDLLREGRGTHFDPDCVDAFMARLDDVAKIRERYTDDQEFSFEAGRT